MIVQVLIARLAEERVEPQSKHVERRDPRRQQRHEKQEKVNWIELCVRQRRRQDRIKRQAASVHAFLANKWGFDDLYDVMFVKPAHVVAKFAAAIDKFVFDEILHTFVRMGIAVSKWDRKFDEGVIDGIVNLMGNSTYSLGISLRNVQTGRIRQ